MCTGGQIATPSPDTESRAKASRPERLTYQSNPEDVLRKVYAALNRHDINAAAASVDPNFVFHSPFDPEPVKGREAYRKSVGEQLKTLQAKHRILNMMSKGSLVAVELSARVRAPTGRRFEVRFASFNRVNSKGLIAETHLYFDTAEFRQQLGLKSP